MEPAIVVILFITLLKGFNQEQILLPPGPIIKEVGASVLFTAMPSSLSISAIKWHFNGADFIVYKIPGPETVIPEYQGRVVLNITSGTLELMSLTMADSGKYTVTITFTTGIGIANYTFLQVLDPILSLGISGPIGNLIEHHSAAFTCEGNGSISTTVWMKDNEILDSSSSITFSKDNRTMVISPLIRTDSGNYQCVLSNPISSSNASYNMLVNYGPDVRIFGLQMFQEGSDILLFCLANSEPYATLRWTVKGELVRDGDLYIRPNSNQSHSGDYKCTCWNNITGITRSAVQYVTVRAVSFRLPPGAETGITLGVVFAIEIAIVVAYVLIKRPKKSTQPPAVACFPMSDQQTKKVICGNNNVVTTISTATPQATAVDRPDQNNTASQPLHINRPTLPPKSRPAPRDRQTFAGPVRHQRVWASTQTTKTE